MVVQEPNQQGYTRSTRLAEIVGFDGAKHSMTTADGRQMEVVEAEKVAVEVR